MKTSPQHTQITKNKTKAIPVVGIATIVKNAIIVPLAKIATIAQTVKTATIVALATIVGVAKIAKNAIIVNRA